MPARPLAPPTAASVGRLSASRRPARSPAEADEALAGGTPGAVRASPGGPKGQSGPHMCAQLRTHKCMCEGWGTVCFSVFFCLVFKIHLHSTSLCACTPPLQWNEALDEAFCEAGARTDDRRRGRPGRGRGPSQDAARTRALPDAFLPSR